MVVPVEPASAVGAGGGGGGASATGGGIPAAPAAGGGGTLPGGMSAGGGGGVASPGGVGGTLGGGGTSWANAAPASSSDAPNAKARTCFFIESLLFVSGWGIIADASKERFDGRPNVNRPLPCHHAYP